jgi:hypothetical protein
LNGDKGVVRSLLYQVVAGHQLHSRFPVIGDDWASSVLKEITNVVVESHAVVKHHAKLATGCHKKVELMQRRNVPVLRLPGNHQRYERSHNCQRLLKHHSTSLITLIFEKWRRTLDDWALNFTAPRFLRVRADDVSGGAID